MGRSGWWSFAVFSILTFLIFPPLFPASAEHINFEKRKMYNTPQDFLAHQNDIAEESESDHETLKDLMQEMESQYVAEGGNYSKKDFNETGFYDHLAFWGRHREMEGNRGITSEARGGHLKVWIVEPDIRTYDLDGASVQIYSIDPAAAKNEAPVLDRQYAGDFLYVHRKEIFSELEDILDEKENDLGPRKDWSAETKRRIEEDYKLWKGRMINSRKMIWDLWERAGLFDENRGKKEETAAATQPEKSSRNTPTPQTLAPSPRPVFTDNAVGGLFSGQGTRSPKERGGYVDPFEQRAAQWGIPFIPEDVAEKYGYIP